MVNNLRCDPSQGTLDTKGYKALSAYVRTMTGIKVYFDRRAYLNSLLLLPQADLTQDKRSGEQ